MSDHNSYFPLVNRTHYSILRSPVKPEKLCRHLKESGFAGSALTDTNSVSAIIQFYKQSKEAGIKPILGTEIVVDGGYHYILAKNIAGWKKIIKLISEANHPDNFDVTPRLTLSQLSKYGGDLICITGHSLSTLPRHILDNPYSLHLSASNSYLDDCVKKGVECLNPYKAIFGSDLYLGVALSDSRLESRSKYTEQIKAISKYADIQTVAIPNPYYLNKEDYLDQRVLLCTDLQTTLQHAVNKISIDKSHLIPFFHSDEYHLPSDSEFRTYHEHDDIKRTWEIADKCEEFDITNKPQAPKIATPNGMSADEYLKELCRKGWARKIQNKIPKEQHGIYLDRIKHEMSTLEECSLSSYFLVVQDIIRFMEQERMTTPVGRGSAAGCLVSYLLNITQINPIPYKLSFERFYNKDRKGMPDIDLDVPHHSRDRIIDYLRSQYGHNRVSQICTYQSIKGRAAIKEVLRCYGGVPFEVMNKITDNIEDESKIADELEEMREEEGESSLIKWALENRPKELQEWCEIDSEGNLSGPLAIRFQQAIRLEGCKKTYSKHAGGVVISHVDLDEICPLMLDKEGKNMITAFDMGAAEDVGLLKFDILGITQIDILETFQQICKEGVEID